MPILKRGKMIFAKGGTIIDEINNANTKQMIAPANNVFDRPNGNGKTGESNQRDEQTTTRNFIENGTLIVEQYDRHGRLIRKTPPGYLPLGERV